MCCPEHRKTRFPIFQKNRETGFSVFIWWTIWGSNPRPQRCERCALPAELIARVCLTQLTCRSDSYYTTFCGRCHLLFRIFPQSFSCRNLAGPPRKNLRAAAVFLLSGGRRGSVFYAVSGIFRRLPSLRPVRPTSAAGKSAAQSGRRVCWPRCSTGRRKVWSSDRIPAWTSGPASGKSRQIRDPQDNLIRSALHLRTGVIRLKQIINRQIVDGKEEAQADDRIRPVPRTAEGMRCPTRRRIQRTGPARPR